MLKKAMAAAAVAASLVGMSAAAAPQALAVNNDTGTTSASGNGATEAFGNSVTGGNMSPQLSLVQGSLNKLCVGLPAKAQAQSILAAVNVGVQDIPVLSNPQNQQCAEDSTQAKGDETLSGLLSDASVLSTNR
ncbi:rodlin [Streptomyces sp. NPDC048297]|uniref:rodlin n=1 Tax=Streptomyces sp. NPDC048297 TaxID=3365531 RepID=UPI0037213957